jgi:hypothetical protein
MAALGETTIRQLQRNSALGYVDRFGHFAGLTATLKSLRKIAQAQCHAGVARRIYRSRIPSCEGNVP